MSSKALLDKSLADLEPYWEDTRNELFSVLFILFEHCFKFSKAMVLADKEIDDFRNHENFWKEAIDRLKNKEPIQYIIGQTNFQGQTFFVNQSVLIPRPETEELVDLIVQENKELTKECIWDMGTGSGCIAISLALRFPDWEVWAFDNSEMALQMASKNADYNHAKINTECLDILNPANLHRYPIPTIIVSNPPYVLESESHEMKDNVLRFEPKNAIFVENGHSIIFYEKILQLIRQNNFYPCKIYFEINPLAVNSLKDLLKHFGIDNYEFLPDFFKNNRFLKIIL